MKIFGILFFIIAVLAPAAAQTATPPDIQIIKASWSIITPDGEKEFTLDKPSPRKQSNAGATSGKTSSGSPFPPEHDPIDVTDRRIPTEVQPPPGRSNARANSSQTPPTPKYLYQVTVKNTGAKEIKALDWEYIFTDSVDQSVAGQHRFQSRVKISPNAKKQLRESSLAPPTRTINARTSESNPQQPFLAQVRITRIEYADGSVWERPSQ